MADQATTNDPKIWPACDCGTAYVLRHCLTMTGMKWLWQADCKHPKKESHTHTLMTEDGPYAHVAPKVVPT